MEASQTRKPHKRRRRGACRQERRNASVGSCSSLILKSASNIIGPQLRATQPSAPCCRSGARCWKHKPLPRLWPAAAPVQVDVVCLVCRLLAQVRVPPARPPAASCYGALLVLLLGVCALARARLYIANSRISGVLVAFLAVSASGAVACCSAVVVVMRAAAGARRGSRRAPLRTCPNMTAMFPQHLQLLPRASRSCMYASSVEHAARSS